MDVNFLDPNYTAWLIPVPPFIAFLLITLFIGRYKFFSHITAIGAVMISWLLSWSVFFHVNNLPDFGHATFGSGIDWLDLGATTFRMGVSVDPLSAVMLFMVPIAMLMIFVYSVGYMNAYPDDDPHQVRHTRFFAYLSLFAGAMLTLVVSDNLLLLFMGWEVMGLCSYLLIGFLFEKKSAYQAAVKAFMVTRTADVLFLVGIGYLYAEAGTLNFREILYANEGAMLVHLATTDAPLLGISAASLIGILIVIGTLGKAAQFPFHIWLPDAMEGPTPVSAMIHAAAMVSAGVFLVIRMYPLIAAGGDPHHGEYTEPLILMGLVGAFTALFAAVLGVGQNDVKRVLAYSTISQLGFMIAALGIGAYVAAFFHMITHAFFKALLFMSSGAVIHAMEHGEHHVHAHHHGDGHGHDDHGHGDHGHDDHGHGAHDAQPYGMLHASKGEAAPEWNTDMVPDGIQLDAVNDPNDMRNMGGLWKRIPVTAFGFLVGGLSLSGFPLITAGFWSKDEIFADAWTVGTSDGVYWLHMVVFVSLFLAACFTAFYTGRQWLLTFWGKPRSEVAEHATLTHGHHIDEHALENTHPAMHFMRVLQEDEVVDDKMKGKTPLQRFLTIYRDSFPMQLPLVILSFFALTAGFVGIHEDFPVFEVITGDNNFFKNFVSPGILAVVEEAPDEWIFEFAEAPEFSLIPVFFSFFAALGGLAAAWALYGAKPLEAGQRDPVQDIVGDRMWLAMQNRFYIDDIFLRIFYVPFEWFGRRVAYEEVDNKTINELLYGVADAAGWLGEMLKRFNYIVIDGVGDGIPKVVASFSSWFRQVQGGKAQQYMLYAAIGLLVIGVIVVAQAL